MAISMFARACVATSDLTVAVDATEDAAVQIKLSGGTAGNAYLVEVTATCSDSQVLKAQIRVYVD